HGIGAGNISEVHRLANSDVHVFLSPRPRLSKPGDGFFNPILWLELAVEWLWSMRQQTAMVATAVLLTLATLFVTEVTKSWGSNVQLATVLAVNILLLLGLSRFERPIRRRIGKIFDIKRIIGALKDLALQSPFAKSLHQRRFRL